MYYLLRKDRLISFKMERRLRRNGSQVDGGLACNPFSDTRYLLSNVDQENVDFIGHNPPAMSNIISELVPY